MFWWEWWSRLWSKVSFFYLKWRLLVNGQTFCSFVTCLNIYINTVVIFNILRYWNLSRHKGMNKEPNFVFLVTLFLHLLSYCHIYRQNKWTLLYYASDWLSNGRWKAVIIACQLMLLKGHKIRCSINNLLEQTLGQTLINIKHCMV